ncbi:MAG: hypothetical protein E6H08_06075 [Bacteroidetes bacterium]|nr:MAG: hypothetical protein E6H08_06075 [Bacteroidota bacterium]
MKLFLSILLFITLTAFVNSCSKSGNRLREGTIELKLSDCEKGNIEGDDLKLCFEAVVGDSRCPANAVCVWQGAATASFSFTKNGDTHRFNLSTIAMKPNYSKDTVIAGYKIEFINLSPYPGTVSTPVPDDQIKAELKITKQ